MKKVAVLLAVLVFLCYVTDVMAGGDKVRGEKGQGEVYQYQVMDPPPFQP